MATNSETVEQLAQDYSMRFLFDNQRRFSRIGYVAGYYAANSAWVKCTDGLPVAGEQVMVFANGSFGVSSVDAEGQWDDGNNVSHWMLLPDAPVQEEVIPQEVEPEVEPVVEPVVEGEEDGNA